MSELRDQCSKCPWRDPEFVREEFPAVYEAARSGEDGFVCHTRMGPCDGPVHAGVREAS